MDEQPDNRNGEVSARSDQAAAAVPIIQSTLVLGLADDEYTECGGTVHENLVVWTTSKYRPDQGQTWDPADIEIYDIDTGVFRRVTTRSSMLSSACFKP